MSKITLRLKEQPTVPMEAEVISPDRFVDASHEEVRGQRIYVGKRRMRLDDFFEVEGERSDNIEVHGDLQHVKWLGREMSRGSLTVHGNVGMHLGAYMKGGAIEVQGNAGDWVGGEMKNGLIRIAGNAGGQIGGAYRGSLTGMRRGTILIGGSVGLEVGLRMRRGTIVIGGPAKDFTGLQMKGGTILLQSGAEIRTGAWMVRGTIISLKPLPLLPTFSFDCRHTPLFTNLLARSLAHLGIELPCQQDPGYYECYSGDSSVPGRGEILVWQPG